jgi:hypothetical protein
VYQAIDDKVNNHMDMSVIWSSNSAYLSFPPDFINQMFNCKQRLFSCYLIANNNKKRITHANFLIYDTKLKTLERFEPNGHMEEEFNPEELDEALQQFAEEYDLSYISGDLICPRSKAFQYIQYSEILDNPSLQLEGDPRGWCTAWSLFYADLRIQYPDMSRSKLIDKALFELKKKGFTSFIRNYANYIAHI